MSESERRVPGFRRPVFRIQILSTEFHAFYQMLGSSGVSIEGRVPSLV